MLLTHTMPRTPRLFFGGLVCVLMSVWGIATHAQESILDQDRLEPGWFLALCEHGVTADILQAIELREGGYRL